MAVQLAGTVEYQAIQIRSLEQPAGIFCKRKRQFGSKKLFEILQYLFGYWAVRARSGLDDACWRNPRAV